MRILKNIHEWWKLSGTVTFGEDIKSCWSWVSHFWFVKEPYVHYQGTVFGKISTASFSSSGPLSWQGPSRQYVCKIPLSWWCRWGCHRNDVQPLKKKKKNHQYRLPGIRLTAKKCSAKTKMSVFLTVAFSRNWSVFSVVQKFEWNPRNWIFLLESNMTAVLAERVIQM